MHWLAVFGMQGLRKAMFGIEILQISAQAIVCLGCNGRRKITQQTTSRHAPVCLISPVVAAATDVPLRPHSVLKLDWPGATLRGGAFSTILQTYYGPSATTRNNKSIRIAKVQNIKLTAKTTISKSCFRIDLLWRLGISTLNSRYKSTINHLPDITFLNIYTQLESVLINKVLNQSCG